MRPYLFRLTRLVYIRGRLELRRRGQQSKHEWFTYPESSSPSPGPPVFPLRRVAELLEQIGIVANGVGGVWVFGAERRFADGEGAAVKRLGLGVTALVVVERRQVVEAAGGVRVFGSEHCFVDGEGAAVERLGLGIPALVTIERRQVV